MLAARLQIPYAIQSSEGILGPRATRLKPSGRRGTSEELTTLLRLWAHETYAIVSCFRE